MIVRPELHKLATWYTTDFPIPVGNTYRTSLPARMAPMASSCLPRNASMRRLAIAAGTAIQSMLPLGYWTRASTHFFTSRLLLLLQVCQQSLSHHSLHGALDLAWGRNLGRRWCGMHGQMPADSRFLTVPTKGSHGREFDAGVRIRFYPFSALRSRSYRSTCCIIRDVHRNHDKVFKS
jgi:hypothetical protein